jgi:hypothetical protein
MVVLPTPTIVTVFPAIVATDVLLLVNVTGKPEVEVADKVKVGSPTDFAGNAVKVIDWSAFARVTTNEYVLVVVLFCAVTSTVIVLLPTLSAIAPEAEPLATLIVFTFTEAVASANVGVTVRLFVALATLAV